MKDVDPLTKEPPMKLDEIIERYTKLRDLKAQAKAMYETKMKSLDAELDLLENKLLVALDESGVESVRTSAGTAYKTITTYTNVADWQAVLRYIQEHGHWHLLQRAVSKKEVEALLNETGEIPPGVNLRRQVNVNIRRG